MALKRLTSRRVAELMSRCTDPPIDPADITMFIGLLADTISSSISYGYSVTLEGFGKFFMTKNGWVKFVPSERFKQRYRRNNHEKI